MLDRKIDYKPVTFDCPACRRDLDLGASYVDDDSGDLFVQCRRCSSWMQHMVVLDKRRISPLKTEFTVKEEFMRLMPERWEPPSPSTHEPSERKRSHP
jgi:hypothetical protein